MEDLLTIHESEVQYRFNSMSGPKKYLLRGPRSDFGWSCCRPGEDFNTHYHRKLEELLHVGGLRRGSASRISA